MTPTRSLLRPFTLFAGIIAVFGLLTFAATISDDLGLKLGAAQIVATSFGHLLLALIGLYLLSNRRAIVARLDSWAEGKNA